MAGYTFDYWKGSEYHPGDKYTVTEHHTMEAQWKAADSGGSSSDKSKTVVDTGDSTNVWLFVIILAVSLIGIIVVIVLRRRK